MFMSGQHNAAGYHKLKRDIKLFENGRNLEPKKRPESKICIREGIMSRLNSRKACYKSVKKIYISIFF